MELMKRHKYGAFIFCIILPLCSFFIVSLGKASPPGLKSLSIADSTALEDLGEALFSDTRFSSPDGKFSGLKKDWNSQFTLSCKSCHMVDEKLKEKGMRGYTDFSRRTPVPYRNGDASPLQFTHRRTQQLINIAGSNIGASDVYHWDGEFNEGNEHLSLLMLIEKTFISRNMGWRSGEEERSKTLRLKYILEGNKISAGGSAEEKPSYIEQYCKAFGISREEFFKLSGDEILSLCNEAIAFYIENIKSDVESSFDLFLRENGVEDPAGTDEEMLNRFLSSNDFRFINKTVPVLNSEIVRSRKVKFGKKELEGLKLFMDREKYNCSSCHTPPSFTDNRFYNIGVSEFDYKDVHGIVPGEFYSGENILRAFETLEAKTLKNKFQVYPELTATESIDLGHALFSDKPGEYIGSFRTPTLRNLKYCEPYLHSGRAKTIEDAIDIHFQASSLSLAGKLHFVSSRLSTSSLNPEQLNSLVLFLKSLNDHYE